MKPPPSPTTNRITRTYMPIARALLTQMVEWRCVFGRFVQALRRCGRVGESRGQMHGTLEQLRDCHPGAWLLIQLDHSEAEEGTVLFAHEDPEVVDKELERHFQPKRSRQKPLYITYSVPEGQDLPAVAL